MNNFRELCKKNNLKVTPQRSLIFKELVSSREHPSAEDLYRKVKQVFPAISFDTVYRNLLTFQKTGIADILALPGEPKRFDGNKDNHHHFRCLKCGRIIDIFDNSCRVNVPESIAGRFVVTDSKIVFEGICDRCKKNDVYKKEKGE